MLKNPGLLLTMEKKGDNGALRLYPKFGKSARKNKESYSTLVTHEMGKPIKQSVAEIENVNGSVIIMLNMQKRFLEMK